MVHGLKLKKKRVVVVLIPLQQPPVAGKGMRGKPKSA